MGEFSIWHWLIVLAIVVVLFGAGKLPTLMGDFAKGIKAFKAGMKDEEEPAPQAQAQVSPPGATAAPTSADHAHDRV